MGDRVEILDTYWEDAQEWQEAQAKYGQLRELDWQIAPSIVFEGVRSKLKEWEDDKER